MKKSQMAIVLLALLTAASLGLAQANKYGSMNAPAMAGKAGQEHPMMTPNELKWGPAPPMLPMGAQIAILDGDPMKSGKPFTLRLKTPDGYKIPPHWHPTDENIVILEGALVMGMGEKADLAAAKELGVGSFARFPKKTPHYGWSKGETITQVYGVGPFEFTYVNPADDPRKLSKK
jgi:hypothetical protein